MTRYCILLSSMLLASSTAGAQSFAYMYDVPKLQREKPRYEQRMSKYPLGQYRDRIGTNIEAVYRKVVHKG